MKLAMVRLTKTLHMIIWGASLTKLRVGVVQTVHISSKSNVNKFGELWFTQLAQNITRHHTPFRRPVSLRGQGL
jgi:hypothetical protein